MNGFDGCRFCHGRGCLACEAEKARVEAEAANPNPIFVISTPEDLDLAGRWFGKEAVENGENLPENALIASVLQAMQKKDS